MKKWFNCDKCGKFIKFETAEKEYEISDLDNMLCLVGAVCEKCNNKSKTSQSRK